MKPPRADLAEYDNLQDKTYKRQVSDVSRQHNKDRKGLAYACRTCGKNEAMLENGAKLLACAKCRKIDRKVWYCSRYVVLLRSVCDDTDCRRECQLEDWKNGKPRPHKVYCGKPMDEQAAEPVESVKEDGLDENGIPPPDPGYQRSPALLHQIALLSDNPEYDYIVSTSILILSALSIRSLSSSCNPTQNQITLLSSPMLSVSCLAPYVQKYSVC